MANKTKIEWTDYNWNFLRGCSRVSEGCRHCYAETVAARFSGPGQPYEGLAAFKDHKARWTGEIGFFEDVLMQPLRWTKPRKVFVNSMSDLFHEKVTDEMLDKAFAVMALTPQHTYQVLTKRPERMLEYFAENDGLSTPLRIEYQKQLLLGKQGDANVATDYMLWPLPNIWLGVSVEDQKTAAERIPLLLQAPAWRCWISAEPLLGPVDLSTIYCDEMDEEHNVPVLNALSWVVCGGESGPNARPMQVEWVRIIKDQCQKADVAFFFKQGSKANWENFKDFAKFPFDLQIRQYPA